MLIWPLIFNQHIFLFNSLFIPIKWALRRFHVSNYLIAMYKPKHTRSSLSKIRSLSRSKPKITQEKESMIFDSTDSSWKPTVPKPFEFRCDSQQRSKSTIRQEQGSKEFDIQYSIAALIPVERIYIRKLIEGDFKESKRKQNPKGFVTHSEFSPLKTSGHKEKFESLTARDFLDAMFDHNKSLKKTSPVRSSKNLIAKAKLRPSVSTLKLC
ncbi:unnamed protein product [Blepharisma stoltei]|uniref:Uncharacterized protein n=1 Tax=Blepharisma stoltei TaxID=1481888 RepID=A0AAU9J4D5_9CILI|nr:unnamed protein product [Blepharisma stoltei]